LLSKGWIGWFRFRCQLVVSNLKFNLGVVFEVMKPSGMCVKARIGGSNCVGAIMLQVPEWCDSLFTTFATNGRQQQHRKSLYPVAEFSTREAVKENIDGQEESKDFEE
jgi:hypothetical protein